MFYNAVNVMMERQMEWQTVDILIRLSLSSLIWVCNISFINLVRKMHICYTLPHVSGGVLCFHVGRPCVCPSVCPPVRSTYVRPSIHTSFPFDNLSIYKRISFIFCIRICTNYVSLVLGLLMGKFPFITQLWQWSMYKT